MRTTINLPFADELLKEVEFSTSRSSGKGGQHVNTTETRVELTFDILISQSLTESQKELLMAVLSQRLKGGSKIRMYSQKERSQALNKADVINRFLLLIAKSLQPLRKRISTRAGKAVKEKRLRLKKVNSMRKELRKYPSPADE